MSCVEYPWVIWKRWWLCGSTADKHTSTNNISFQPKVYFRHYCGLYEQLSIQSKFYISCPEFILCGMRLVSSGFPMARNEFKPHQTAEKEEFVCHNINKKWPQPSFNKLFTMQSYHICHISFEAGWPDALKRQRGLEKILYFQRWFIDYSEEQHWLINCFANNACTSVQNYNSCSTKLQIHFLPAIFLEVKFICKLQIYIMVKKIFLTSSGFYHELPYCYITAITICFGPNLQERFFVFWKTVHPFI